MLENRKQAEICNDNDDDDDDDDDYGDGDDNDDDDKVCHDDGGDGHFISLGVCPVPSAFGNVLLKSCIWGQKSRNLHCEHITFLLNGRRKLKLKKKIHFFQTQNVYEHAIGREL